MRFIMAIHIRSLIDQGFGGTLVDIECHISNNLPNIIIVGIANTRCLHEQQVKPAP